MHMKLSIFKYNSMFEFCLSLIKNQQKNIEIPIYCSCKIGPNCNKTVLHTTVISYYESNTNLI